MMMIMTTMMMMMSLYVQTSDKAACR